MKIDADGVITIVAMFTFVLAIVIDLWPLGIISIMILMASSIDETYQRKMSQSKEGDKQ